MLTTTKGHGHPNAIDQADIVTRDADLTMMTATTRATK
jgi:hypothetical protein